MDRLQKKCFIGSAGAHLLLGLTLFVGPAFLMVKHPPDSTPILDFVPFVTTDAQMSGGGNPNVHSAPPAPPAPPQPPQAQPQPAQPRQELAHQPEPAQPAPRETRPEQDTPDLTSDRPRHKIEVSTKPVVRRRDSAADSTAHSERQAREQARAQAEYRQHLAQEVDEAASAIGNGVAVGTDFRLRGRGGGGLPYANWEQAVASVYSRAWLVPDGVTDDNATVSATVTIARDGSVVSAHITHSCGNAGVDRSVQAALDRVTHVAPLPPSATEDQRTVPLNFNVRARRLMG